MKKFNDLLATLATEDTLQSITLTHADGSSAGMIENQLGSQGSLRVYAHLYRKYGHIDSVAAQEGIAIYAEHSNDAKLHLGKHPNIDRLLAVIAQNDTLHVSLHHNG